METSRLTWDGTTAEPISRDQILRRERGQGNTNFSVQLTTSRIGNLTRLMHTQCTYMCVMHAIIILIVYNEVVIEKGHDGKEHVLLYYVLYIIKKSRHVASCLRLHYLLARTKSLLQTVVLFKRKIRAVTTTTVLCLV